MMDSWHGLEKHTEYGKLGNSPVGLQSWEGGDLSTVPTNHSFHGGAISPEELDSTTTKRNYSTALPPARRNGCPSTRRVYKRRRKRGGDSTSDGPQLPESEKHRISLEKNRRAAAKCREKKRSEIQQLAEITRASAVENNLLKQQTMQMREEILDLGSKLLTHVSRGECRRPEEVRMVLDDWLDRFRSSWRSCN